MSEEVKKIMNWRRLLVILFWLIIAISLTLIILSLIQSKTPGRNLLTEIFSPRERTQIANEYSFEVGRDRVYEYADGSIASVGTLGLHVLSNSGNETLRDSFRMTQPALTENNGFFLAFDITGTVIRMFNTASVLCATEIEGQIVSASINRNGWFCVVTQERGGYRGIVTVYNRDGLQVYRVSMGSGFVLSAILSDDNKALSILNISESGSRLTLYYGIDTDKDDPDHIFYLGSEIFLEARYLSNSKILAISTEKVIVIDLNNTDRVQELYNYSDKRVGGYTYCDAFLALHIYDYSIGYNGRVVTLDYDGSVLGEIILEQEVISLDSIGNALVLLHAEGVAFYSNSFDKYAPPENDISASTATYILALSEDIALAANDHSAIVVRRGEGY